jgi:hypothetical protein
MQIEAIERPIRYRLATGRELILRPGVPVEVPEQAARQLLQKAGGKVRAVFPPANVGNVVSWRSPLFGSLQGAVLMIEGDAVLVDHPTIGQPAWICRSWLIEKGDL